MVNSIIVVQLQHITGSSGKSVSTLTNYHFALNLTLDKAKPRISCLNSALNLLLSLDLLTKYKSTQTRNFTEILLALQTFLGE
jgi:hypothetical protein